MGTKSDIYQMYGELKASSPQISEALGDNKIDNLVDELHRSLEVELGMFAAALLNANVMAFQMAYSTPQFEGFRTAFANVVSRYRVMDGQEQGDLFHKVEILFKDIFVKQYAGQGPETSEMIGQKYATQMVKTLKKLSIQANTELYPEKSWY